MTWAKLCDSFWRHPKIRPLSDNAFRVHVAAIDYCADVLSDGVVASVDLPDLVRVIDPGSVPELVAAGLWVPVAGGWEIHDWKEYNPTRAQKEADRAGGRLRSANWRARNGVTNTVSNGARSGRERSLKPVPNVQRTNAVTNTVTRCGHGGIQGTCGVCRAEEAIAREAHA